MAITFAFIVGGLLVLVIGMVIVRRSCNPLAKDLSTAQDKPGVAISIKLDEEALRKAILQTGPTTRQDFDRHPESIAGFYGQTAYSENGRYALVYVDHHHENDRHIRGKVALIDGKERLFKKTLYRPMEASVSNQGIAVSCDATFSEGLTGKFYCWDRNGNELFAHTTTANLGKCIISANAELAIFETYGSTTEDSNCFFIVDILKKEIVHKFRRRHPAVVIQLDVAKRRLNLIDRDGIVFICDFEGNQLNEQEFEQQILDKADMVTKLRLFDKKPMHLKIADDRYIAVLQAALADKRAMEQYRRATIYRQMGEWHLARGEEQKVITCWERALIYDPKVGVKRKLEALKKEQRH